MEAWVAGVPKRSHFLILSERRAGCHSTGVGSSDSLQSIIWSPLIYQWDITDHHMMVWGWYPVTGAQLKPLGWPKWFSITNGGCMFHDVIHLYQQVWVKHLHSKINNCNQTLLPMWFSDFDCSLVYSAPADHNINTNQFGPKQLMETSCTCIFFKPAFHKFTTNSVCN